MRLFLAVEIPKKVKEEISTQIDGLKKEYPQFMWITPDNYHVTTYFFGERNDLESIKKKLEDLLFDQDDFYLYTLNCGIFIKNRITLYINFIREKKIEAVCDKVGAFFNQGKSEPYLPHLTIARAKIPSKQQYFVLKKKLEKLNIDASFHVKKITLFQSLLGGRETVYKKIATFPLITD